MVMNRKYKVVERSLEPLVKLLGVSCEMLEPVGDMRMGMPHIREVVLLAVPKVETVPDPDSLFGELKTIDRLKVKIKLLQSQGVLTRLKGDTFEFNFRGHKYPFRLKLTTKDAWVTQRFQMSCSRDLYITVATAAKAFGCKWVPAQGGYVDNATGELTLITDEREIFEKIKVPFMPMDTRGYGPVFRMDKSILPMFTSRDEVREWAKARTWVDTYCGGEHHYYTFRTEGNGEAEFIRMAEFIRTYGYDDFYYGTVYRCLDLDGMYYFDNGWWLGTTWVLNRKVLPRKPTPWARNPKPWVDKGNDSWRTPL